MHIDFNTMCGTNIEKGILYLYYVRLDLHFEQTGLFIEMYELATIPTPIPEDMLVPCQVEKD